MASELLHTPKGPPALTFYLKRNTLLPQTLYPVLDAHLLQHAQRLTELDLAEGDTTQQGDLDYEQAKELISEDCYAYTCMKAPIRAVPQRFWVKSSAISCRIGHSMATNTVSSMTWRVSALPGER